MEQKPNNMSNKRQRAKYVVADVLSALVVWICFLIFRWLVNDGRVFGYETMLVPAFNFYTPLFVYPAACLLVHYLSGYYVRPYQKSAASEFLTTLLASVIIATGAFFAIILDDQVPGYKRYYVSSLALFLLQFVISYVFRLSITQNTRRKIRRGQITQHTALIGTGKNARKLAAELRQSKKSVQIIGFISLEPMRKRSKDVIGSLRDFAELKNKHNINSVVIALDDKLPENELFKIIDFLFPYGIEIQFIPRVYEILTGAVRIRNLDVSPLVNVTKTPMSDWETAVKRAMDILISIIALVLSAPLFCFCAIGIKRCSQGPVFYKQERIGLHGKPFDIVKLRTMYVDAEQQGRPMLSNPNDERIIPFGKWLRKYRIDELPQFINILRGEMSLVGPRPERRFYINQIVEKAPYYCLVYKIRPGLTSWGPIKIGYSDTVEKMIERLNYDIIYMDNMSLKTDLNILWYTVEVIVKGKGQ